MSCRPGGGGAGAAVRRPLLAILAMLLVTVLSVGSSPAESSLNLSGTWKSVYHCHTGSCAGQDFPAGPFELHQARGSSTVTSSDSSGTLVGHTLRLHSTTSTGYTYTSTLTIAADGRSWTGKLSDSNGTSGTDTGTRIDTPHVSLAVSIASPVGAKGADIGEVYDVTVRVKARGGDLKDVRLSNGLMIAGAPSSGARSTSRPVAIRFSSRIRRLRPAASRSPMVRPARSCSASEPIAGDRRR